MVECGWSTATPLMGVSEGGFEGVAREVFKKIRKDKKKTEEK